jgi:hypothetical protein
VPETGTHHRNRRAKFQTSEIDDHDGDEEYDDDGGLNVPLAIAIELQPDEKPTPHRT